MMQDTAERMQEPNQTKKRVGVISNLVVVWRKEEGSEVVHFAADHDFGYANEQWLAVQYAPWT